MSSAVGFGYTSSPVNEVTGIDMKTEVQSEINLVNAGINQMKKAFFFLAVGPLPTQISMRWRSYWVIPKPVLCRNCVFQKIFGKGGNKKLLTHSRNCLLPLSWLAHNFKSSHTVVGLGQQQKSVQLPRRHGLHFSRSTRAMHMYGGKVDAKFPSEFHTLQKYMFRTTGI